MKPDFALDFRDNQISLLHRADGVWAAIGRVAMDDPDLDAAMGYLRATALGLSPRGIATKLILPNDAILYTQMDNLPYDAAKRTQRIVQGLVGRTPYDVADLVYDWTDEGDSAHLAVIARETLAEAEGFASQHRFNPISFAALPDQGGYEGEVWFGATQLSETLLAKGEVVERDEVTVFAPLTDVAGQAPLAASDFEMGAGVADLAQPEAAQSPLAAPATTAPPPDVLPQIAQDVGFDDIGDTGNAAPADDTFDAVAGDDTHSIWPEVSSDDAGPAPSQPDLFADSSAENTELADAPPPSFDAVMDSIEAQDGPDEAPMAVDVPLLDETALDDATLDDAAPLDTASAVAAKAPSKSESLLSAFAARRAAAKAAAAAAAAEGSAIPRSEPLVTASVSHADEAAGVGANVGADTGQAAITAIAPPDAGASPAVPSPPKLGSATADLGTAPPIAAPSIARPPVVKHVPAKTMPNKGQNLKSMPAAKAKGGVKMGWVLTIALLVALMVAAALSTYLLEAANKLFSSPAAVASLQPLPQSSVNSTTPSTPAPIDLAATGATVSPAAAPASVLTLATRAEDSTVTVPKLPAIATPAPKAAPTPQVLALPKPRDTAPPAAVAPNTTSLAAVAPSKPSLVPAPRPLAVPTVAAVAAPSALILADPALAAARPTARPQTVVAAALASQPAANLAAAVPLINANPALQDARPLPRPAGVVDLARAAQLASAPASLLASASIDAAEEALLAGTPAPLARPDPNRSKLAVAISPAPAARPKGLKAAFDAQQAANAAAAEAEAEAAAVAAAVASAAPAAPAAPAAASEDVAALESEVEEEVTRADGGATRSIVAKQATVKNALDLSQANLVGIFGSKANRYALVRQPSGMFKKLKVGDRFDGGRIAAITESEVRYDKGGELLALTMPRG